MDAKQLGAFIAERRKQLGLTQVLLAEQLHVTDKAVSRWERGVGLPDIGNLEALADALDVSLVELLQAQRKEDEHISTKEAEQLLMDTIQLSKKENKFVKVIGITILLCFVMIFVMLLGVLISDWRTAIFSVGSIITGLIAWAIPIWNITIARTFQTIFSTICSLGFAMLSLMIQFLDIANEIHTGDTVAVIDTIDGLVMVVFVFCIITLSLNMIHLWQQKKSHFI